MSASSGVVPESLLAERDLLASIVVMDDDDEFAGEISEKIARAGYVPERAAGAAEGCVYFGTTDQLPGG